MTRDPGQPTITRAHLEQDVDVLRSDGPSSLDLHCQ